MEYKSKSTATTKRHGLRNRFKMQQTLGEGTYGKVRLAIDRSTGIKYAIKTIRKNRISSASDLTRIRREIEIMTRLGHPHIISVQEVYENRDKIVLVMEYASGGELYEYINTKGALDGLPDHEARKFFRQIVSAVYYLHQNGIVHRDLKLENIFIDCRGYAKIGDFGLANLFEEGQCLKTFCGSPLYASPEIVNGRPYVGPEADCWSLGVLLYTLVYGAMPFDGSDFNRLRSQISQASYYQPTHKSEAADLIRQLLTVDVSLRATPEAAATHWWTNLGYTGTPIDNYSCLGRPVDYYKLKAIVYIDESADHPQKSQSTDSIISNSQSYSSPRNNCGVVYEENGNQPNNQPNRRFPRGILKKNCATSEDEAICMTAPAQDFFDYDVDVCSPNESVLTEVQNEIHSEKRADRDQKSIYDSERRPKKGILKNSDQPSSFDEQLNSYIREATECTGPSPPPPYDINDINTNGNSYIDSLCANDEINIMDYFTKSTPPYDESFHFSPTIYPDRLNLVNETGLSMSESDPLTPPSATSGTYDSGISEPSSLSQQDDWDSRRWDHERTDSQESNMSLASSLWGGSSHSSAPPCPEDSGGEESSTASTVVYPSYDMTEISNAITGLTDSENNSKINNNNTVMGLDDFGNQEMFGGHSSVTAYFTDSTVCDHECNVTSSPIPYIHPYDHNTHQSNRPKGILKKQTAFPNDSSYLSQKGNRHSYGSTASSHCSSLDNSRHRDDLYGSSPRSLHAYEGDESSDYQTSETLHRDSAKQNIMINLLQQQL